MENWRIQKLCLEEEVNAGKRTISHTNYFPVFTNLKPCFPNYEKMAFKFCSTLQLILIQLKKKVNLDHSQFGLFAVTITCGQYGENRGDVAISLWKRNKIESRNNANLLVDFLRCSKLRLKVKDRNLFLDLGWIFNLNCNKTKIANFELN